MNEKKDGVSYLACDDKVIKSKVSRMAPRFHSQPKITELSDIECENVMCLYVCVSVCEYRQSWRP